MAALVPATSMASAGYSTAIEAPKHSSGQLVSVATKVYQTSTSAVTRPSSVTVAKGAGCTIIEIQGSVSNAANSWVPLARLNIASAGSPTDGFGVDFSQCDDTAFGANATGAYIANLTLVKSMPYMRVSYPALANASIVAEIAEF